MKQQIIEYESIIAHNISRHADKYEFMNFIYIIKFIKLPYSIYNKTIKQV